MCPKNFKYFFWLNIIEFFQFQEQIFPPIFFWGEIRDFDTGPEKSASPEKCYDIFLLYAMMAFFHFLPYF